MADEKKYADFPLCALGKSNPETLPVTRVDGITCRCSGLLQGCDQHPFDPFPIYLEIQAKSQVKGGFTEMWSTG